MGLKLVNSINQGLNFATADIFTKGLSTPRFSVLLSKLLVMPCPISLWGDVKESISIHDSADLVGKTAISFPNIILIAIAKTKSTSTSVMEI